MSLRAHLWALDSAPVKNPTAVLVLVALSDEANDDGEGACPYMDKIVQRARCSERSAQEHLRNLFRARVINPGDPGVARRRYKKSNGRLPRVWDLNLEATWGAVPEPRTEEEMLAYSDQIGKRPTRRSADQDDPDGVQDLHPADGDGQSGVQDLHPTDDITPDQAGQLVVDEEDQEEGCSPPHPWGAAHRTPGVQPTAPFPSVPAYPRSPLPVGEQLTEARPDDSQEGEVSQKNPTLDEIVTWFARRRPDWEERHPGVIREALTAAVAQQLGDLRAAAAALRELAEGKHGDTGSPRRLLHADGKWWPGSRSRRSVAAAATLAASPRCSQPGHERQPADGCKACVGERKGRTDEDHTLPVDEAVARGARFLPASRRGGQSVAESVAS